MVDAVVIGGATEVSEEASVAALSEAATNAPSTTEEALAQIKAEQDASSSRPAWLPEKFNSAEDFAKSYQELERKLGQNVSAEKSETGSEENTEAGEATPTENSNEGPEVTEDDVEEAPAETDDAPLSNEEVVEYLTGRFSELGGKLDAVDYQLALDHGYPKAVVDGYIAGQQAIQTEAARQIHEAAGGQDNLDTMLVWATTGLNTAEIAKYNADLASSDTQTAVKAVAELKARFEGANGREVKLIGGKPGGSDYTTYGSWAEVSKDMEDPRYKTDKAFEARVVAKLGRSNNIR